MTTYILHKNVKSNLSQKGFVSILVMLIALVVAILGVYLLRSKFNQRFSQNLENVNPVNKSSENTSLEFDLMKPKTKVILDFSNSSLGQYSFAFNKSIKSWEYDKTNDVYSLSSGSTTTEAKIISESEVSKLLKKSVNNDGYATTTRNCTKVNRQVSGINFVYLECKTTYVHPGEKPGEVIDGDFGSKGHCLYKLSDNSYFGIFRKFDNMLTSDNCQMLKDLGIDRIKVLNSYNTFDESLVSRADEIVLDIKDKKFDKVSEFVHPNKGLFLSPHIFIRPDSNKVFTKEELLKSYSDNKKYIWGLSDGSGFPIELTFAEYINKFVYDRNFQKSQEVSVNKNESRSNSINNIKEALPKSVAIEYYFVDPKDTNELSNWGSLWLVFEKLDNVWYLVGIAHDQWNI